MPENLYLDYYSVGIPVIFIAIGIILYLQSLLKKRLGAETIAKCHEVGSYYLSMVGTFYAVLLGLIVVDAMTKFQEAQSAVDREMTALIRIYSSAERFPEQRAHLEKTVTDYADEVIDVEFPMMERRGRPDEKARDIALEILQTVKGIEPVTENQKAMFPILLSDVSDLLIARRERTKATNFGEPTVEWIILVTGGLITIILTFFFTIESHAIHPRTFHIDPSGRLLVAQHNLPVNVREGDSVRVNAAGLSVFRIGDDGKLTFVRKYDVEVPAGKTMFWMGMVAF